MVSALLPKNLLNAPVGFGLCFEVTAAASGTDGAAALRAITASAYAGHAPTLPLKYLFELDSATDENPTVHV